MSGKYPIRRRTEKKRCGAARGLNHLVLITLILITSLAFARSPKLSKDLNKVSRNSFVDVIVQFKQRPTSTHFNKVKARGGALKHDFRGTVKGGLFRIPASALDDLANDPDVTYISLDRSLRSKVTTTDFYDEAVNAAYAADLGLDGSGIGVAVIDSGISPSSDFNGAGLQSRVVYSENFVNLDPTDQYGHGTHVAGIIAGNGSNSAGPDFAMTFKGIAPNATLLSLKVLDQHGGGTDSGLIAAIQKAIELKSTYNIRVINLSVGRAVYENYTVDPLCQAVEAAWNAGIVVVVAAGNDGRNNAAGTNGYGTINAPGNDPYVITVGAMKSMNSATRADDLIASFSSKGPSL